MAERVSDKNVRHLKCYIVASYDASRICKRAILWLIDQTDNLSKPCQVVVDRERCSKNVGENIIFGVHDMNSPGGNTQLCEFMESIGCRFDFRSSHNSKKHRMRVYFGGYDGSEIPFDWEAICNTDLAPYWPRVILPLSNDP